MAMFHAIAINRLLLRASYISNASWSLPPRLRPWIAQSPVALAGIDTLPFNKLVASTRRW